MRFLTAGESHGKALTVIIEGMPAGLEMDLEFISKRLALRRSGYGRGGRMKIETDSPILTGGVVYGKTTGAPLSFLLENKDHARWSAALAGEAEEVEIDRDKSLDRIGVQVTRPRPGHADLAGAMKYGFDDIRPVIERASARETAARVIAGSAAQLLLKEFGIKTYSRVVSIGRVRDENLYTDWDLDRLEASDLRVLCDPEPFIAEIKRAKGNGDSLGGVVEVKVTGMIPGLGSYVQWDRRLDGRIAQAVMSIPAIKGVEIGLGFAAAGLPGSMVHDAIGYTDRYFRLSNNAGGIEGGISNGEDLVVRAAKKPIPTLYKPLKTVEIKTHEKMEASIERSDVTAVPAASIVVEAMVAWVIAESLVEKFGGDSLTDMKKSVAAYLERLGEI
jgi:chorismate synthase